MGRRCDGSGKVRRGERETQTPYFFHPKNLDGVFITFGLKIEESKSQNFFFWGILPSSLLPYIHIHSRHDSLSLFPPPLFHNLPTQQSPHLRFPAESTPDNPDLSTPKPA